MKSKNLSFPLWRTLLATACLSALTASAQAQTLVTSFENPPFAANTLPAGVDGWSGSTAGNSNTGMRISSAMAYNGTQSLLAANGATAGYYSFSGNLFSLDATSISFFFTNPTATFTSNGDIGRFEVYYNNSLNTDPVQNHRFYMKLQYGATELDPYRLEIANTGSGPAAIIAGTHYLDLPGSQGLDLDIWNEVVISLDLTGPTRVVNISVGDYSTSIRLAAAATELSRISYVRFQANTTGNGVSYYDYITVPVPEPTTLTLLALCGAAFMAARRQPRLR